jgi:serine/threonine protein kinase
MHFQCLIFLLALLFTLVLSAKPVIYEARKELSKELLQLGESAKKGRNCQTDAPTWNENSPEEISKHSGHHEVNFDDKHKVDNISDNFLTGQPIPSINKGKLILGSLIGVGAFSKVVAGWYGNPEDGSRMGPFAVKIIPIKRVIRLKMEAQLKQEIRFMGSIKECKNLVKLHGVQVVGKDVILIMDLAGFGNLEQHLDWLSRRSLALKENHIKSIGGQIFNAVRVMHNYDLLHRDLRPANVIITSDGFCKVCDFGMTVKIDRGSMVTAPGSSLLYAPPEQLKGEPIDLRYDVWSFGVILYELCTLTVPFMAPSYYSYFDLVVNKKAPHNTKQLVIRSSALISAISLCLRHELQSRPFTDFLAWHPWIREVVGKENLEKPISGFPLNILADPNTASELDELHFRHKKLMLVDESIVSDESEAKFISDMKDFNSQNLETSRCELH